MTCARLVVGLCMLACVLAMVVWHATSGEGMGRALVWLVLGAGALDAVMPDRGQIGAMLRRMDAKGN